MHKRIRTLQDQAEGWYFVYTCTQNPNQAWNKVSHTQSIQCIMYKNAQLIHIWHTILICSWCRVYQENKTKAQLLQVNNKVKDGKDRTSTQANILGCSGLLSQPSLPSVHYSLCQKRTALPIRDRIPPVTASYTYPLIQILGLAMCSIPTISMRRKSPFLPSDELFSSLKFAVE